MVIRRIDQARREAIDEFIVRRWFALRMVVRGESVELGGADGWYAREGDEIVGLLTVRILGDAMELLSFDSLRENRGVGTALLNEAVARARALGLSRIVVITTNDNLSALRFYQKRGFDLARLYRNAVDLARKLKPEIPLTGDYGIPLRHEIELELIL